MTCVVLFTLYLSIQSDLNNNKKKCLVLILIRNAVNVGTYVCCVIFYSLPKWYLMIA